MWQRTWLNKITNPRPWKRRCARRATVMREKFRHDMAEDDEAVAVFDYDAPDNRYIISDTALEVEE